MNARFQELMKHLFRHMKIDLAQADANEAYSVLVDNKIKMEFFMAPESHLNVISSVGSLPEPVGPQFLIELLDFNCFTPIHPYFNFKVGVAKGSKKVELWVRAPLDGMESEKVIELFDCTVELGTHLKHWIDNPRAKQKSACHISRILARSSAAA
jgi:hypothetical protein